MNTVTLPNGYENDARVAYLVESLLEECEGATVIQLKRHGPEDDDCPFVLNAAWDTVLWIWEDPDES